MSKKLYKVTLRGMTYSASGPIYGVCYVVAKSPTSAYEEVKAALESKGVGFSHDRELSTIELIAEASEYPDCKTILYLA